MTVVLVKNNEPISLSKLTFLDKADFAKTVLKELRLNKRMIGLLPLKKGDPSRIIALFADNFASTISIVGGDFKNEPLQFESFANEFPHTNFYECELAENNGFTPLNHPWLRPVRRQNVVLKDEPYKFYSIKSDEIHEVAVGPIHAGVIEPGHFRFQCHGELVYNLEINLGYQHRAIENLIIKGNPVQNLILAESIAGDTVMGNMSAHCNAIEGLSNIKLTKRAEAIRFVGEEIERIAMHIGCLSGMAIDVGFALAAHSYGRIRTIIINSLALICGSRFGRGLFKYGGTRFDITEAIHKELLDNLKFVYGDIQEINKYMFSAVGALARFETTGRVSFEDAKAVGLTGIAGKSCGVKLDVRTDFPYGSYNAIPFSAITLENGDVFARGYLRALEINESFKHVIELLENLTAGDICEKGGNMSPDSLIVSMTEGFRGEIVHVAATDNFGKLMQYKIKDPSFVNWYGLSLALRNTAISDFPLCNKSFDLSYAGHDL
ncbi:MAG: hydrogenase [bacterium]